MKVLRGRHPGESWADLVWDVASLRGEAAASAALARFRRATHEFEVDPEDAAWQVLDREGLLPQIVSEIGMERTAC